MIIRIIRIVCTQDETRTTFPVSVFGFLQGGILNVTVKSLTVSAEYATTAVIGLSLDRTQSDAANPYLDSKQDRCEIDNSHTEKDDDTSVAKFKFNFATKM